MKFSIFLFGVLISCLGQAVSFPSITPTGIRAMAASEEWGRDQINHLEFPQPAMCALNVSVILDKIGLRKYASPLVPVIVEKIKRQGGITIRLPKDQFGLSQTLNAAFQGRIPPGALVSGCLRADCTGEKGDGHISIVGFNDENDVLHLYHNNWYRPDNFNPPIRKPWMVSEAYYSKGLLRQWMSTPWLKMNRTDDGNVVSQSVILPEIDDLDPTNYFVTISIPKEIIDEGAEVVSIDQSGNVTSRPPLDFGLLCRSRRISAQNGANFRNEPRGTVVSIIPFHSIVEAEGSKENDYVKVNVGDSTGWVHSSLLEPVCE
jgi:hypothetical protein